MKLLYSDILPLNLPNDKETFINVFEEQFAKSTEVSIAVGYISYSSLAELDKYVQMYETHYITLTIGMYYSEGMSEHSYHAAIDLHNKWQQQGIGEIRIVTPFKYHGKVYCFSLDDEPFSVIVGSANLGIIKQEASNKRQYEVSMLLDDKAKCKEVTSFLCRLNSSSCSDLITNLRDMPLIREENTALANNDKVKPVLQTDIDILENYKTDISFELPIKVPAFSDRHSNERKHFTKSNINVCYAQPRTHSKPRDWYETQITVSRDITTQYGYPVKNDPFVVITDDGYKFLAHTTSSGNKQLSAVGDELILGRWMKGRLVAAGLVSPVNNTQADINREGMITKEMLSKYGCDSLILTKTDKKEFSDEGRPYDIWLLEFKKKDSD